MNTRIAKICLPLIVTFWAFQAQAESLVEGSVDAGKAKSITCTACHGAEGNSVNPLWPNIAGQSATYTFTQLAAFKDGSRSDPLMSAQAMLLSAEDMRNLAVYFESLPAAAQAVADPGKLDKGEALYRGGDSDRGVAACLACHGPSGRGNPAASYPALQGQHATYTAKQLHDYASGKRKSDGKTRVMRDIAARLSDADIDAVSSYVQGLR
ncbi:MAG: cytochrome c4 [Gammaproteobacteria bacterium]|nr:cytochrome c4 [Gammaproteobacteria bacterium]MDH3430964.1 cytochrome c4 [Gammaproteobacteria bacterium]